MNLGFACSSLAVTIEKANACSPWTSYLNFCYLNINLVRNTFTDLLTIINVNVDIVSMADRKLDASFPSAQLTLEGYHTSPSRYK